MGHKSRNPVAPLDRNKRQQLCIDKWKFHNGVGTIVASTGFGRD